MQESINRNRNRTARTFNAPTDQQAQALEGQRVHANGNDTVGNGFFGHLKDSADAGFFNTIGGAARFAGYHFDSETFNQIADWASQQAEYNTADPNELTGANYIANAVGNAVGSSAASLLGGAVAIGAAKTLGLVIPATKVAAVYKAMQQVPALGRMVKASQELWTSNYGKYLLTNVAGSPLEAASEAGNLIDEMRAKGYTNDEIRAASLESAAYNTGWLTVANMLEGAAEGKIVGAFGKTAVKEGLKSIAKQSAKVGAFGGASEGIEEYGQSLIGNIAKGEDLDHEEASAAALQGAVGGLFLGGLRGGIDAYADNLYNKTKEASRAENEDPQEDIPQIEPPKINVNPEIEQARKTITDYRDSLDDEEEYGRLTDLLEYGNDDEILEEAKGIRNTTAPIPEQKPVLVDEGEVGEDDVVAGEIIDSVSLEPPVIKEPVKTKEPIKTQEPTETPPKDQEDEYTTFRHTLTAGAKSALQRIKKDGTQNWGAAYNEITEPINKAVFEGKLKEEDAKIIKDWIGNAVKQIKAIHNSTPVKTPWQTATNETATIKNGTKGDNTPEPVTPATTSVKPTTPVAPQPPKPVEPKPPKPTEPEKPPKPVEPVKPTAPVKPVETTTPIGEIKRDKYGYAETLGKFNTVEGSGNGKNTHFYATKDNKVQKVVLKTTGGAYVVNTATIDNDGKTINRYAAFKTLSEAEDSISSGKTPKGNKLRAWAALVKDKKTGKESQVIEAYESISDLVKEYESKGYEILIKSTAETFKQKLAEYKNKQNGDTVKNTPKDEGDIKRLTSDELNEVRPYEGGKAARQHVVNEKLTQEITDKLIEVVTKKTGLLVITDANKALSLLGGTKYKVVNDELKTQKGRRVLGFYHPVLNFFYIQTKGSDLSSETTVHEFTHWWNRYVAQQKPVLWQKGIELLKKTKAWNNVRASYTDLRTDDEIANEVLAQLSGYNFQQTLKNLENQGLSDKILQKLKLWFKKYWETVKTLFQSEDARVAKMTLEEFVNMPLVDLLKDLDVSTIKPTKPNGTTVSTGNQSSNSTADVVSRKFDAYVRTQTEQTKKILEKPEVKEEVIAMCLGNPKIEHNKEGSKNLYRVTYTDANGKVIQKNVKAAIHHAVGKIAGVKSTKYEKKAPATTISSEVIDKIRGEKDVSDFAKSREIRVLDDFKNLGFSDRVDAIEDVLTIEMTDGITLKEELHEVVIKELPLVGKDNFGDSFMDFEEAVAKWLAEDYGLNELEVKKNKTKDDLEQIQNIKSDIDSNRNILKAYYEYLINKYNTSGVSPDFLIEPVSEEHSEKIKELEQRLANKESRLKIWRETGWYKAKDGRWKYIISDNLNDIDLGKIVKPNGEFKVGTETTVGELYNNPELYSRFPYLKDVKVETKEKSTEEGGHYDHKKNTITVRDAGENSEWYKRALIHEMEHAIQAHEGMARGSNPEKIIDFFQKTREVMLRSVLKYSDEASDYFEGASQLMLDEFMLYGGDFKAKKEEVKGYKEDFYAIATPEEIKDVERYLSVLKNNLKNMEENEMSVIGDPEYADTLTYMNTLGEEEARMAMYFTKEKAEGLSEYDKELSEKVVNQIEKLPKKVAKIATKYIFDSSSARSDSQDWKFSEYELGQHPKGQALIDEMMKAENKADFFDSLAPLHFIMGHDDHSVIFLGDGGKVYSEKNSGIDIGGPSVETRLRKAVTTVKPTDFNEEIDRAGGKKSWLNKQWRKFYRSWVDKNIDIKDLDGILSGFLGRSLTSDESIYNKVQMANSAAAGVAHGLIEGDAQHLKSLNKGMKKPMKHTNATLANVLDIVNAEKMNKIAPDYLAKFGKGSTWVEAFGTYLGWRRLAEMARLKREAYNQELAEWTARKAAYNAWVDGGKIGDNPQVAAYKEWEAFEKRKRQLKRQWEKDGKTYENPVDELNAQWLKTHKDLEAPKRYVGKEPEFEPYQMPENLTEQEVRKAIQSAPAQFAEAAKLYYQLNDNLLCVMEDAGMIDGKLHELLNTKYKEYCPMVRDFSDTAAVDEFVESITNGGKGVANVSTMLKKIREEGSKRAVINPLESTLKTIAAVTNRAERNKAGQHLVKMMTQSEDLNGTIRKLQQPKHGTIAADPKNCIFTVMFNGKKMAYQADPDYYQAIVGYNMATSSLLLRIPQTVARTLRTGATMSPSFIVRNIFRDTITAGIASSNGFVPIVDTIRGGMELWRNPEFRAQFESAGIVNFNQYGDAEHVYKNLKTLNSGKNYTVYEPMDIIKGVLQSFFKGNVKESLKTIGISFEQLSSFAESATRAGEFKKAIEAGKSVKDAAYDAKEVTIDFSRSGIIGQEFNRVIPFFNACIQGGDKMIRLFHSNPKTTALRVAQYILLPSLALWLLNYKEDWYEELEPSVKYTHWCLPNGVRVPKPQEYGVLFGGGLEAMLDQAVAKDAKAMKEWADAARDAISPSILPTIILPLIEWVTNYSFFKGRDLVPQRLQRMPDELQYSSGTSEASKFIGRTMLVSPVKVDNLIRGYTGTMGMFLWQTPDWFAAEKQNLPSKKISEMQFVRDFNVTQAVRNRFVNDFYELQNAVNQQHAGYGKKGKPSAVVKAVRNAGKIINNLNSDIRAITDSPKYTPERKRELIDKKMERINNVAKHIVKKYGEDYL